MNQRYFKNKGNKGSILVTAFLLSVIVAMSIIWMTTTLMDHQKINRRRREMNASYYAAQAGLAQVQQWGNYPAEYDGGGSSGLFLRNSDNTFPNLATALPKDSGNVITVSSSKLRTFTSKYNVKISKISSLQLIAPATSDPVSCLFKVRSVGEVSSGVKRSIFAYMNPSPIQDIPLQLGAGIISLAAAAQVGNGKAHWGESWSKQPFDFLSKSQCDNLDKTNSAYDPFAKYRTESRLIFGPTWKIYNPSKPSQGGDVHDVMTAQFPGSPPASGNYENAFEQFIAPGVLQWPDFAGKYADFKSLAKSHGRYYSTDPAGNIYRDGVEDSAHLVDFNTEFSEADRVNSPYDLVFIDTIDGNPPAVNGSNLATVSNSGTGIGMKGIFYICANYDQAGAGNPADLPTAEKPILNADGSITLQVTNLPKVFLDGVIYTSGTMQFKGNPVVYGALVSNGGYLSGGTPDIYYNPRLKDGLQIPVGNVGSAFNILLQQNLPGT